jgi:hypothetical protein
MASPSASNVGRLTDGSSARRLQSLHKPIGEADGESAVNLIRRRGFPVGRLLTGVVSALVLAVTLAGPVAAYSVVYENGPHGDVWLTDSQTTTAGTCNYGPVVYSNWIYLVSMSVRAPHVFAADRNSDLRDHRVVTWQWKLQRGVVDDGGTAVHGWTTLKSSPIQKKTAYEDQEAAFTAMSLKYDAYAKQDPHHQNKRGAYRALVIVKWFKPNGSLEATVKLTPTYYKMKQPAFGYDIVGDRGYCNEFLTSG